MDWFSLSLLSAITLAAADAFTKKHLPGYSAAAALLIRFTVPAAVVAPPLLLFYPLGDTAIEFWGWLALLIPLEIGAMLLYMKAIREAPLSQTLPYLSFTPAFNILSGWLVLDERISLTGASGILLIVTGTYLLNIGELRGNGRGRWLEPLRAILHQPGARRMLLVAFIYSITTVVGKAAMLHVGAVTFGAIYFIAMGVATLLLVLAWQPRSLLVLKGNHRWHLIIAATMAVMVVSHFLALAQIESSYMVAVKRLSLLFGILFGAWLLHEKGLLKNLGAASFMVAGVALILLA